MRALIVEDGLSRQALAATRALAARGWEVGIGSPDRRSIAAASRAARAWHRVASPRDGVEAFAADVDAAIAAGGYDLVFGSRDDEVAALASLRDRLGARVAHPPLSVVTTALDKVELTRLAEQAGFAVPRTSAEAAESSPLASRWVVKPRVGRTLARALAGEGGRFPAQAATRRGSTDGELRDAVAAIEAAGEEAVVQEQVEGRLMAVVILAERDHSIVRSYQQRSELSWPIGAGISVRAEVVPSEPRLAESAAALVRALEWTGLAQIQLLAPPDAAPRLIDFNGRFFGSLALAAAAGSNVAAAWALGLTTGTTPDPGPAAVGTRYHWAWGDLRRATQERRGGLFRDLLGVARYGRGAAHSVFALRDPRPAARYARVAGGQARRRRVASGRPEGG